jgi:hypothetical protein
VTRNVMFGDRSEMVKEKDERVVTDEDYWHFIDRVSEIFYEASWLGSAHRSYF